MFNAVSTITRQATRKPDEPLNILTFPTHERYESNLVLTGHNFYSYRGPNIKGWNNKYAPVPPNYILLDPQLGFEQVPINIDIDIVLSQNKFGQFQIASQVARKLQAPLISLEHTLPVPNWPVGQRHTLANMRGTHNVFISRFSIKEWGFQEDDPSVHVIRHAVNTDIFTEGSWDNREPYCLSVVNDWVNRDWCCGFNFWRQATNELPVRVVGDTPGLSKPAASPEELAGEYHRAMIFVNTSLISPVPMALLEAMSCGCAVISTNTCMIPEFIINGQNGILVNNPADMKAEIERLLKNPEECKRLGQNAARTIRNNFGLDNFVTNWNDIFDNAKEFYIK